MNLINKMKVRSKILLMLFLPIIGLLYFSFNYVTHKAQVAQEMHDLKVFSALTVEVADVIHQVQLERGLSGAFVKHQGNEFREKMMRQHHQTDEVIADFKNFIEDDTVFDRAYYLPLLDDHVNQALNQLNQLASHRQAVDSLRLTEPEVITIYSKINSDLIELIQHISTLGNNKAIYRTQIAYIVFLQSKELAGLERSNLVAAFTQKNFREKQFKRFIELVAKQHLLRRTMFTFFSTPEQQALWQNIINSDIIRQAQTFRDIAYASQETQEISGVSPEQWFQVQTQKINLLKEMEDKLAQLLQEKADKTQTEAANDYLMALWSIGFLLVITLILLYLVISGLTKRLNKSVDIANNIAEGDLDNKIDIDAKDETGQLLAAFAEMQKQLRQRIAEEKRISEEALRINQALDCVTTSVMIADNTYKIIYMNDAAKTLFKTREAKLREELPQFRVSDMLNQSIDTLHPDPVAHRRMLDRLQTSEHASLQIHNLTIDYIVTPVLNRQGKKIGIVKEFKDRTLEVATEKEINAVIHTASQGDFQQRIHLEGKVGFFRVFSESINQIMALNQRAVQDIMRMFAALAKGDLTQKIVDEYKGEFDQLKNDINTTINKLTEIVTSIKESAESVKQASEEMSQGNLSLSQRTEEQAASLEQTAASMEQMTSTVQQNADNARQATQLATNARNLAEKGGNVVGSAIEAMSAISDSSRKITDIIGVIDDIAFQTNLLALNAAVEAARAGEQGRGFAVVATEVRNLAQRSASAAKEIKTLIQDSVSKVEEGTKLANKSGETLNEIVNGVKKVSDIISEIAAASQEQSSGIHQVNKAVTQMDEMTQQNAAMVEEAASASESMTEQAQQLKQQVAFFKIDSQLENEIEERLRQQQDKKSKLTTPPKQLPHSPPASSHQPEHDTQQWKSQSHYDEDWEDF